MLTSAVLLLVAAVIGCAFSIAGSFFDPRPGRRSYRLASTTQDQTPKASNSAGTALR